MELSKRLMAVACLVTPGNRLADVGTDHGYIPIYLIKENRIPHAIAMDVNRGPLLRAQEHIRMEGLEERIETRLSDGMKMLLPTEADTVVIAGMGGALTLRILEEGEYTAAHLRELILQPQSELEKVRRWLVLHQYRIEEEDMVLEDGKYYPMMRVVHGTMEPLRDIEAAYGPVLLKKKHPCLKSYLLWEQGVKKRILEQLANASEGAGNRRAEVEEALELNVRALRELQ